MYQTLVEDVSQEDDPYSYGSLLKETAENKSKWIPKPIKAVGKVALMTHDTGIYKLANHLTVMSDFTARYALNQYLKNDVKTQDMGGERRLQLVRDAFIMYDVPTSKQLQWLNDKGLVWFSKYYLRIQHVIFRLVRENPLRALMVHTMGNFIDWPTILHSSIFQKDLAGALGWGAGEIVNVPQEIATIDMFTDLAGKVIPD